MERNGSRVGGVFFCWGRGENVWAWLAGKISLVVAVHFIHITRTPRGSQKKDDIICRWEGGGGGNNGSLWLLNHPYIFLYLLADMDHIWWVVNKYCTFHKSYLSSSPCPRRYFLNGKDWRNAWLWYFFSSCCVKSHSVFYFIFLGCHYCDIKWKQKLD